MQDAPCRMRRLCCPYHASPPLSQPNGEEGARTAGEVAVQDAPAVQERHAGCDVRRDAQHRRQAQAAGALARHLIEFARLYGLLRCPPTRVAMRGSAGTHSCAMSL